MEKKNTKKMTMNINIPKTLDKGYEEYVFSAKARNLSSESITYYNNCYKYFVQFLSEEKNLNLNTVCEDINLQLYEEYVVNLEEREEELSDKTINSYLRGLRAILYFLMEKEYINSFKIKLITTDETIIETYTDSELEALLKKPDKNNNSFANYRNWVIVCTLLATGVRLGTLTNIKIKDLDFENNDIYLKKVKTRKQYTIPITDELKKTLKEYLRIRGGTEDDYLFTNVFGEKLKKSTIQTAIAEYNNSRGVTRTSIHLFRHTFAKEWILNGGDIYTLQAILGHKTLDMVKNYVNMFGKDLHKNFSTFNPLENRKKYIHGKQFIKRKS